jgi:peptide/nickel transport system substrate-binding protein
MRIAVIRRQLPGLLALAVGSTLVAACAAPAQPSPRSPAGQPPAAEQPRDGGILQFASWAPPRSLDYCKDGNAFGAEAWAPVYEGLLSFDYKVGEDFRTELRVVPYLAERWEQPDETTYIFHLRRGVKWQDGQPFTADDVEFSLNYLRDNSNACTKRGNLAGIKAIEKIDGATVRITTDSPMAPLLENLAQRETVIFPKHVHDAGNLFKNEAGAIGTGPMRIKSFDRNEKTVYEAFKDYWRRKPHLDGMVVYYVPEPQARLAGFAAKQFDILTVSDKAQYDAVLTQVRDAVGEGFPTSHGYAMYMRVDQPPLNDVRVRRAIHLALNRQDMVRALSFGIGKINPPGVSAVSSWALPEGDLLKLPGYRLPKDQDIAEAKRLLSEAGFGSGLNISIQAVSVWDNPRIAEVAARQLKDVGITVKLDFIDAGTYFANQSKGDYQIQLNGMSSDFIDASLSQYYYGKAGSNPAHLADPTLDRLIEQQRSAMNKETRYGVLRQIQEYLLDKLYSVPTVELGFFWLAQPYVHNVPNSRSTTIMLYRAADVWLDSRAPQRTLP